MPLVFSAPSRRGQVAVEYLLVVMVLVGVALVGYQSIRSYVRKPLGLVKNKMENGDAWSGGKKPEVYYTNVEFKAK